MTDSPAATKGYVICSTGRTGSTWFAELLASTNLLGRPREFFNTPVQRQLHGAGYPADRREQVRLILTEGTTPNGIYGLKVFPRFLRAALDEVRWSRRLPELRFVHWRRRDILGQALSRHRASHTLQWRSHDAEQHPPPPYDGEAIVNAMRWAVVQNARWELYFARNGLVPLRFVYEEVMKDPQAAVDAVAALVGLDERPPIAPDAIRMEVQRDALSSEWRRRFLDEYGDIDTMDLLDVDQAERPFVAASTTRS